MCRRLACSSTMIYNGFRHTGVSSLENNMMQRTLAVLVVLVFAGATATAGAQDTWPVRPVKLIVPSSPGGGTDVFARLLAQSLTESTKQSFIVENKPGASGNIGAQAAATATPDGYTFLVAANASIAINHFLLKSPNLD